MHSLHRFCNCYVSLKNLEPDQSKQEPEQDICRKWGPGRQLEEVDVGVDLTTGDTASRSWERPAARLPTFWI